MKNNKVLHARRTAYLIWPSPWPYTEWRCAAKVFWNHRPFITFRLFFLPHCAHTKPGLLTKSVLISKWHLLQNVLAASVLCGQSTEDHILNEAMLAICVNFFSIETVVFKSVKWILFNNLHLFFSFEWIFYHFSSLTSGPPSNLSSPF